MSDRARATALVAAAGLVAIVAIIATVAACAAVARRQRRRFYTGYAVEEPTRDYIPYTGTIPNGTWGVKPWAMIDSPPSIPRGPTVRFAR
jgi:hypothetical protein